MLCNDGRSIRTADDHDQRFEFALELKAEQLAPIIRGASVYESVIKLPQPGSGKVSVLPSRHHSAGMLVGLTMVTTPFLALRDTVTSPYYIFHGTYGVSVHMFI